MDSTLSRQIRKLKELMDECYVKMIETKTKADKYVANIPQRKVTKESILFDSNVANKKARDSVISLNRIYKDVVYDDYSSYLDIFFRNAKFSESNAPEVVAYGSMMNFYVKFKNSGVFWAWTKDKGIKLVCEVIRSDGASYDTEKFLLDVNLDGNAPGDENSNGDYRKIKTFNASIKIDMPPGEYVIICSVTDKENRNYNGKYTAQVRVI